MGKKKSDAKTIPLNPTIEPATIKEKIALCREKDKRAQKGAYRMGRCLSETEVAKIERQYDIEFPEDYRTFLTRVGNGGPGPCDTVKECQSIAPDAYANASKPFPHAKAWNLSSSYFDGVPEIDEDNEEESYARQHEYLSQYWEPAHSQGAIPFSDEGCGASLLLVVTGDERGTVWTDERMDEGGILPVAIDLKAPAREFANWWVRDASRGRKGRVTFAQLYNYWLDWNMKRLRI